jgi:MTH538 TIR-like domain (DUF1863)
MAKLRVFISYDYDHDKACKDRLLEWDTNQEYDFRSYNQSFGVSVDSPEATAIKQDLAARIGDSGCFLCIIGKDTYRSGWAVWEILKAVELKKKLVAVKTDSINNSPTAMQGVGASWSAMFNFDSIKSAIN